jgi:hypothetical protein
VKKGADFGRNSHFLETSDRALYGVRPHRTMADVGLDFCFQLQEPPVGQCPTETFSPMFVHDFDHILLTGCPIDLILFHYIHNFDGIISTLLVGVLITLLHYVGFGA